MCFPLSYKGKNAFRNIVDTQMSMFTKFTMCIFIKKDLCIEVNYALEICFSMSIDINGRTPILYAQSFTITGGVHLKAEIYGE